MEAAAGRVVDFAGMALESHVRKCLDRAHSVAAPRPISARDVLYGAVAIYRVGQAPQGADSAFAAVSEMFQNLDEITGLGTGRVGSRPRNRSLAKLLFTDDLASSWELAKSVISSRSRAKSAVWGRDFITIVLLAGKDPSLTQAAREQNTTVAELQDRWFAFVTAGRHRSQAQWERWWHAAKVPLPSERYAPQRIIRGRLHPLVEGEPPEWASGWGHDRFGVYVSFTLDAVTQRLRWVQPGRFTMGSPADEDGRYDDEGPQHEVMIAEGFWLFDTPCTQALWEAVTGANHSRFKSPQRPVEQVSFEDARRFISQLNDRVTGLELSLPSEAQWEYACRAGTEAATYAGAMRILGENNAPVLDEIAWYGGNSGVGFELNEGVDSRRWREKQHPHEHAGTRPVSLKAANPWGFHDMLGNVWEWCADQWHDRYDGAPTDGSAWLDGEGNTGIRVVRGGSWNNDARLVRAAFRFRYVAALRSDFLGFRCAGV